MAEPTSKPSEQNHPPKSILELIAAFNLAIKTERLYASGHALCKKIVQQLYTKIQNAMADRDFLILGCSKKGFYLEGNFYQAVDEEPKKFLKFFHSLGISHLHIDRDIETEELQSLMELLAGAGHGQGEEVSSALPKENIKHVRLGLLGHAAISNVQKVAAQVAQTGEDEAIWRQLILQPASTGTFNVSPEKIKQLKHISEDMGKLKKLLLKLVIYMTEKQQGISAFQRGALLSTFIQNLGNAVVGIDPEKTRQFAKNVGPALHSLEPRLRMQILGAEGPEGTGEKERGVIHEIFQEMPDSKLVHLLVDALKEAGANSPCFNNLFKRAQAKFGGPDLLLGLVRKEMHRITLERRPGILDHWQYLEQLFLQQQESEELNEKYHMEIKALATSIQLKVPMAEEAETARLLQTLSPESLRVAKAKLIIDLLSQPPSPQAATILPSLLKNLGEILSHFLRQGRHVTVGKILRALFLALRKYSQEASASETINSLFTAQDIRELLKNLLNKCRSFEPKETTAIHAVSQLYPEKAGAFLLDLLINLKDDDSPQAQWLLTTLGGLGTRLHKVLRRKIEDAPDHAITRLMALAAISADKRLTNTVEEFLDHQDHEIQLEVVNTLGRLQAEQAVPRLAQIVLQKGWVKSKKMKSLQLAAARALSEIGTDEAQAMLQQAGTQASGDLRALCQELA